VTRVTIFFMIISLMFSQCYSDVEDIENSDKIITVNELKKKNPDALMCEVSMEEYEKLSKSENKKDSDIIKQCVEKEKMTRVLKKKCNSETLSDQEYASCVIDFMIAYKKKIEASKKEKEILKSKKKEKEAKKKDDDLEKSKHNGKGSLKVANSSNSMSDFNDNDEHNNLGGPSISSFIDKADSDSPEAFAIIVFVVIGIVVVASIIVPIGKLIIDLLRGDFNYNGWVEFSLLSTLLLSENRGSFHGAKLSAGFKNAVYDVGLASEFGYLTFSSESDESFDKSGFYLMIGPAVRWYITEDNNPVYFLMELLAGKTEHQDIGLMSVARVGFDFGVGSSVRLGFSFGSVFMDWKITDGAIRKYNDFNLMLGAQVGYRF